jgi:hypothetical protein
MNRGRGLRIPPPMPPKETTMTTDTKKPLLYIYSFGALSREQLDELFDLIKGSDKHFLAIEISKRSYDSSEHKVEFKSSLEIEEIHKLLATLEDSDVMFETLRMAMLRDNDLERSGEINPYTHVRTKQS